MNRTTETNTKSIHANAKRRSRSPNGGSKQTATDPPPPDKRLYGSGIVERCRKRFRARVRNPDKTKRTLGIFDTEAEAQAILDGYFEAVARNKIVPTGTTLRAFGITFFEEREVLEKKRSVGRDRNRWDNWILEAEFADWPLHEITNVAIRDWMKWILKQPIKHESFGARRKPKKVSPATTQRCLSLLHVALEKAKTERLIESNPADGITVPGLDEAEWEWLRLEDQQKWERYTKAPNFLKYAVMFAYGVGQRRQDQWDLKLTDLHLDAKQPYVTYKMSKRKPGKKPKWVTVPLFGAALRALQAWLPLLPKYCPQNPNGLVWPARDGGRRVAHIKTWPEWCEKAGITRYVKWHELRHTFGSSLISGIWGRVWRLEEVREVMGHSNVSVTERYAHLAPAAVLQAGAATKGPEVDEAPPTAAAPRGLILHPAAETDGQELAHNWPTLGVNSTNSLETKFGFLNRRSQVRFLPGALKRRWIVNRKSSH